MIEDSRSVAPLFYRAASIIPVAITDDPAKPILNTVELRKQPLRLDVYPSEDEASASGDLYWDDGDSLESISGKKYSYYHFGLTEHTSINITALSSGYTTEKVLVEQIRVHGPFKRIMGPGNTYTLTWKDAATGKERKVVAKESGTYITFSELHLDLTALKAGEVLHLNYHLGH